jgi:putative RNA 2'-phosphotransferase
MMGIPAQEGKRVLKECRQHGYFRAEICPKCDDKGRFLMNDEEIDTLGRIMAGILRHFPERFDLHMDERGWVEIGPMINAIADKRAQFHWLRVHHIKAVVSTDPKGRYQIDNDKIRATYGHSINVDLDLPTDDIPPLLYYPATEEEADIILEVGLKPSDRKKVHLSLTVQDAVNASAHREAKPVILEIDTDGAVDDGGVIMQAGKTVFITDSVKPEFLKKIDMEEALAREAEDREDMEDDEDDETDEEDDPEEDIIDEP